MSCTHQPITKLYVATSMGALRVVTPSHDDEIQVYLFACQK